MPESDIMSRTMFGGMTNYTNIEEINPIPWNYEKMGFESTAMLRSGADVLSLGVYLFIMNVIFEIVFMLFEDR